MFPHPDAMYAQIRDHQRDLLAEAARSRVLTAALRRRRAARKAAAPAESAPRSVPESTLAACGERAAAPAR
ncbi:MAG: hypothetical protein GEV10_25235 [Streptosporangiales bacterium]|nr:hypothetical protein [Streptosporangiales bacterium]